MKVLSNVRIAGLCIALLVFSTVLNAAEVDPLPKALTERLTELKFERDYGQVIFLLENYREKHPDDQTAFLELADAYLTTESYAKLQRILPSYQRAHPDCWACYSVRWNAIRESQNRSPQSLKKIRAEVKRMEAKKPGEQDRRDYLQMMFEGYQMLDEYQLMDDYARKIREIAPSADDAVAANDYKDFIRNDPRMPPEHFIELYPKHPEIDLAYTIYLRRRLIAAQADPTKRPEFDQVAAQWESARPRSRKAQMIIALYLQQLGGDSKKIRAHLEKAKGMIEENKPEEREPLWSDEEWHDLRMNALAQVAHALAWQEYLNGKTRRALRHLRALEKDLADDALYLLHRAKAAFARGKDLEADAYFKRALARGVNRSAVLAEMRKARKNPALDLETVREEMRTALGVPKFTEMTLAAGFAGVGGHWTAWGDFDGDGDDDLFVGEGGLFENRSLSSGAHVFIDVTKKYLPQSISEFRFGIWADIDNDGDLDLFLAQAKDRKTGEIYNRMLINEIRQGRGFVDRTAAYFGKRLYTNTAAAGFADYNGDGYLDLYVANYEKPGEPLARGTRDFLFRNIAGKTFREISRQVGATSVEPMCGRGVAWADFDNDGDMDVYVSNYRLDPNFLFRNNGKKTFADVAKSFGVRGRMRAGMYGHSIGSEFGDIDNDGDLDLVTANLAHPRALAYSDQTDVYRNDLEQESFVNVFKTSGIFYEETHSDPSLGDIDNDGDLDLIITATYPQRPLSLYRNDSQHGEIHFSEIAFASGIGVESGWGGAFADYDNDGDLDFVVAGDQGVRLFRNDLSDQAAKNAWLKVKVGQVGARVTVLSPNGMRQIREVQAGKGTGNQHSMTQHFGFGSLHGPVTLMVRFPDGKTVVQNDVELNQEVVVSHP